MKILWLLFCLTAVGFAGWGVPPIRKAKIDEFLGVFRKQLKESETVWELNQILIFLPGTATENDLTILARLFELYNAKKATDILPRIFDIFIESAVQQKTERIPEKVDAEWDSISASFYKEYKAEWERIGKDEFPVIYKNVYNETASQTEVMRYIRDIFAYEAHNDTRSIIEATVIKTIASGDTQTYQMKMTLDIIGECKDAIHCVNNAISKKKGDLVKNKDCFYKGYTSCLAAPGKDEKEKDVFKPIPGQKKLNAYLLIIFIIRKQINQDFSKEEQDQIANMAENQFKEFYKELTVTLVDGQAFIDPLPIIELYVLLVDGKVDAAQNLEIVAELKAKLAESPETNGNVAEFDGYVTRIWKIVEKNDSSPLSDCIQEKLAIAACMTLLGVSKSSVDTQYKADLTSCGIRIGVTIPEDYGRESGSTVSPTITMTSSATRFSDQPSVPGFTSTTPELHSTTIVTASTPAQLSTIAATSASLATTDATTYTNPSTDSTPPMTSSSESTTVEILSTTSTESPSTASSPQVHPTSSSDVPSLTSDAPTTTPTSSTASQSETSKSTTPSWGESTIESTDATSLTSEATTSFWGENTTESTGATGLTSKGTTTSWDHTSIGSTDATIVTSEATPASWGETTTEPTEATSESFTETTETRQITTTPTSTTEEPKKACVRIEEIIDIAKDTTLSIAEKFEKVAGLGVTEGTKAHAAFTYFIYLRELYDSDIFASACQTDIYVYHQEIWQQLQEAYVRNEMCNVTWDECVSVRILTVLEKSKERIDKLIKLEAFVKDRVFRETDADTKQVIETSYNQSLSIEERHDSIVESLLQSANSSTISEFVTIYLLAIEKREGLEIEFGKILTNALLKQFEIVVAGTLRQGTLQPLNMEKFHDILEYIKNLNRLEAKREEVRIKLVKHWKEAGLSDSVLITILPHLHHLRLVQLEHLAKLLPKLNSICPTDIISSTTPFDFTTWFEETSTPEPTTSTTSTTTTTTATTTTPSKPRVSIVSGNDTASSECVCPAQPASECPAPSPVSQIIIQNNVGSCPATNGGTVILPNATPSRITVEKQVYEYPQQYIVVGGALAQNVPIGTVSVAQNGTEQDDYSRKRRSVHNDDVDSFEEYLRRREKRQMTEEQLYAEIREVSELRHN